MRCSTPRGLYYAMWRQQVGERRTEVVAPAARQMAQV
jgi:hypothetical protein